MPNILHVIETLGRGGAEIMFVNYINSLPPRFKNVVVYLRPPHTLKPAILNCEHIYFLKYESRKNVFSALVKLAKIINLHHINLVHAHLYWPTILARLAVRGRLPLVFSVHNTMSHDAFDLNVLSKYLEKLTYSKNQTGVFVSNAALEDYQQHIRLGSSYVTIYNFISDSFFEQQPREKQALGGALRLVSVGNLRHQKNQLFLIAAVGELSSLQVSLDVYGEGPLRQQLENYIDENRISNVQLMGMHEAPQLVLKNYDAFVLASHYEGFCLAMVEAMAVGLPCIVSDIEVLREVSGNSQVYFIPTDKQDLTDKIRVLRHKPELLLKYSESARLVAKEYKKEIHMAQLVALYDRLLEEN